MDIESISCLLPNCALFWFIHISMGLNMNANAGANWSNILSPGYLYDEMTISHIFLIIVISYIIYGLLIWYLSSVIPFKHTINKPFYFPIQWVYNKIKQNIRKQSDEDYEPMFDNQMPPMVHIKDLHKKYYSMFGIKSENILKGIDLDVDRNSIAVILGPNGSGKTTLINVITGNESYISYK
jgi:ABC-type siderophore export system fused ATPase/permease subunit